MTPRPDPLQGLEKRTGSDGTRYVRAAVRIPGTNRKARGAWTTNPATARGDRARLLASQEALGAQAAAPVFPTVAEALEAFLTGAEAGRKWARGGRSFAPKTLRDYRRDVDLWIAPAVGPMPVDKLRRSQIQALVDEVEMLRSGQKARNVATVLQTLYRHLLPRHDELSDPTQGLQLPAGSEPRQRVATPAELALLLAALPERDRAPLALAGLAGLRAAEVRALRVGNVELERGLIVVEAGWDSVEGRQALKHRRDGESREAPIFAALRPYLEDQLATLGPEVASDALLIPGTGRWGDRIGEGQAFSREAWVTRARKAWADAELTPIGLHEARHSFASWLVLGGYDVATIADWIGHRHVSTTLDRYVKPMRRLGVTPEGVREYLGALA